MTAKVSSEQGKKRFLFFDIIRILAVLLIVIHHIPQLPISPESWLWHFLYNNGTAFTYHITTGPIGVYLLVFISGAVMHLSPRQGQMPYLSYVYSRFKRLYPIYWVTLILYLIFDGVLILQGKSLALQVFGFLPHPQYVSWWIGLFFSLYLLYPVLAKLIRKWPYLTLLTAGIITFGTRLVVANISGVIPGTNLEVAQLDRILAPTMLFEFTLGMFIAQKALFPKTENKNPVLKYFADISYYIFLTHPIFRDFLFGTNQASFWQPTNVLFYAMVVLLVSDALMKTDMGIQKLFKKAEPVSSNLPWNRKYPTK